MTVINWNCYHFKRDTQKQAIALFNLKRLIELLAKRTFAQSPIQLLVNKPVVWKKNAFWLTDWESLTKGTSVAVDDMEIFPYIKFLAPMQNYDILLMRSFAVRYSYRLHWLSVYHFTFFIWLWMIWMYVRKWNWENDKFIWLLATGIKTISFGCDNWRNVSQFLLW